ncbi:MAG: ATP-binding protein, partial [Planctomycetes bacterium]|nr:ATP-binding protein [Planctomycetota bacterium]
MARFEEIRNAPLLILDDLGIESPTPWANEKLYQLLNHRYNARLPTIITTNLTLETLELRLRSRLSDPDVSQVLGITAPDYRRAGIAANQSDLDTLSFYRHMTFETFSPRADLPREKQDNLRRALEITRRYAANLEGWLLLIGPYGCGKSHLAASIANANPTIPILFITVPDLLDQLRAAFAPDSTLSYAKRFQWINSTNLLILDVLETDSVSPRAR